jgi:hypothetical protein
LIQEKRKETGTDKAQKGKEYVAYIVGSATARKGNKKPTISLPIMCISGSEIERHRSNFRQRHKVRDKQTETKEIRDSGINSPDIQEDTVTTSIEVRRK